MNNETSGNGSEGVKAGGAGYTPGPWTVETATEERRPCIAYVTQGGGNHQTVMAEIISQRKPKFNEADANARLIAAAPELLAACEAQRKAIDLLRLLVLEEDPGFLPSLSGQPWEALLSGNKAIAKAKGIAQ